MLGLVSNNNVPTNVSDQRLVKVEVSRVHVMVVHVLLLILLCLLQPIRVHLLLLLTRVQNVTLMQTKQDQLYGRKKRRCWSTNIFFKPLLNITGFFLVSYLKTWLKTLKHTTGIEQHWLLMHTF